MDNVRSISGKVLLTGKEIASWFSAIREVAEKQMKNKFDTENNFTDQEMKNLTTLDREQFRNLYTFCDPVEIDGNRRYISKKYLIAFLAKLNQGISDDFISTIFQFRSRQNTSKIIAVVRESLNRRFKQENLGFNCPQVQNKEQFIANHVTEFANLLYNPNSGIPKAILYPDCTYLKIPKSSHFRVQRQSFSTHKNYNLLKAGLIVAPDGYIASVHGPYFSDVRSNDAQILIKEINEDHDNIRDWLDNGDIFVMDRGYRDAIEFLEDLNINCEMPSILPRGQRQFTTEEANQSRKCTKTRWIVEARNGHLKSIFKFFQGLIPEQHIHHLKSFLEIACALINKYRPPIHMQDANADLAENMLNIIANQRHNHLQQRVEEEGLLRRNAGLWTNIEDNIDFNFPRLPLPYLQSKTFGTYQVKISPGYIQDTNGRERHNEFVFQTQRHDNHLLRARVHSRFRQLTKHQIFIQYNEDIEEDPITGKINLLLFCTVVYTIHFNIEH